MCKILFFCLILNTTGYTHTGLPTASGKMPNADITIACMDWLPLGALLYIDTIGLRQCEDRIGHSSELDIFFDTRREALEHGRRDLTVFILGTTRGPVDVSVKGGKSGLQ